MSFDPTEDFETIVDGLEAVTLSVSGLEDQDITHAHRNQVGNREAEASHGQVRQGDTVWQWPVSESPTQPPLGSTITDGDGDVWTILRIDEQVQGSKWSATCRNLAVEANADTLITIQQATYAKGAHGAIEVTWVDAYADVRARVQPINQTPQVEHDADETAEQYRIILATDLAMDMIGADYRIIDAGGQVYGVLSYEGPERIDALPVIVVERTGTSSSSGS